MARRQRTALARAEPRALTIENKLHDLRDRTFDEDRSQVRRGAAAHSIASLCNLAISILRIAGAGVDDIAAAVRHCARKVRTTLRLIGL
jgi:hypothetical protein